MEAENDAMREVILASTDEFTTDELKYQSLCQLHEPGIVNYTVRCFFLKSWKKAHGVYPHKLDDLTAKCIIGIATEENLAEAHQAYVSKQKSENSGSGGMPAGGGFAEGVPVPQIGPGVRRIKVNR